MVTKMAASSHVVFVQPPGHADHLLQGLAQLPRNILPSLANKRDTSPSLGQNLSNVAYTVYPLSSAFNHAKFSLLKI